MFCALELLTCGYRKLLNKLHRKKTEAEVFLYLLNLNTDFLSEETECILK